MLDNATIRRRRLKLAPGAKEQPHTHPYSMLVVILTASEMEMYNGEMHTSGSGRSGQIQFIGAGVSHHAGTRARLPLDALVLAIKADRVRGGIAPRRRWRRMPGVTRTPLLDNHHRHVTRSRFEAESARGRSHASLPSARRPDIAGAPRRPDRSQEEVRRYAVGEAFFMPRDVAHAVANVGTASFRLLGIRIK